MRFGSNGYVVWRSMTIAFIIAVIGCRQSIPSSRQSPDLPAQSSLAPATGEPFDVNCMDEKVECPKQEHLEVGGEEAKDRDASRNYHLRCSVLDRCNQEEEVDKAYARYAWRLFQWLNPGRVEALWGGWTTRKIKSSPSCTAQEDLRSFETLEDCSSNGAMPVATPVSNPIRDIHGNLVEFESRVNSQTTDRLCGGPACEELAFCKSIHGNEWSRSDMHEFGPMHIKLAWKKLVQEDCAAGREFILKGTMQFGCKAGEEGVVAMHVAIKGFSGGPSWTWATFSHRDNVDSKNPMFAPCKGKDDPGCNRCLSSDEPTRIRRVGSIPKWITDLNGEMKGPYRNYLLLGIQRQANAWPETGSRGEIRPEVLANEIIEWDRQESNCIGCHSKATVSSRPGSDKFAWDCCVSRLCPSSLEPPIRAVRCDPDIQDFYKRPIFVADFFWGLEDWYKNFKGYCPKDPPVCLETRRQP